MRTIENRKDVNELVVKFYDKVRLDDLIGPVFNNNIPEEGWPPHLEKLTDFWESNLFRIPKFRGNPPAAHAKVDKAENYTVTQKHFERWLALWYETVDELFEGELAEFAKHAASRMATPLFNNLWQTKPQEYIENLQ